MTSWTREFIEGQTVYIIRPDPNDYVGAANAVYQLLPQLLTGEEIRIRPGVAQPDNAQQALGL
jgi:hypothetical protein